MSARLEAARTRQASGTAEPMNVDNAGHIRPDSPDRVLLGRDKRKRAQSSAANSAAPSTLGNSDKQQPQKKVKKSAAANVSATTQKRQQAPVIPQNSNVLQHPEDRYNNDGEDDAGLAGEISYGSDDALREDEEGPEPHESVSAADLITEMVSFSRTAELDSSVLNAGPMGAHHHGPINDYGHMSSPAPSPMKDSPGPHTGKLSARDRRMAQELPIVHSGKKVVQIRTPAQAMPAPSAEETSHNSDTQSTATPGPADGHSIEDSGEVAWLTHTDISNALEVQSKKKWKLGLKELGPEMGKVVRASFDRAKILLALGNGTVYGDPDQLDHSSTPFESQGMENVALTALVVAAEHLGYGEPYDIADRLETDHSERYTIPLCAYVVKRIRPWRAEIKQAAEHVYPTVANLSALADERVIQLRQGGNFLYPWTADNDRYQYNAPFRGPGIVDVVRRAFFSSTSTYQVGELNQDIFESSLPSAPGELELPDHTLIMAACAIHSVLMDRTRPSPNGKPSEFAGTIIDSAYKVYMKILVTLRLTNLAAYHKLMHKMYIDAIGKPTAAPAHMISQADVLARVDWANVE
ncbi:hypothetical protein C8Q77DRAFT_1161114 [Trametes polyzona]|nr:hypothetical protein C8Q77DRAFT_1161114 [Trametes polyzona]